jgi:hypothetical protein
MAQEAPGSIINLKLVRILAMVCGDGARRGLGGTDRFN